MADETKLIISIETILRGLDKTLKGLAQVERQLKAVSNVSIGSRATASNRSATTSLNTTAAATERLRLRQERLAVQTQELTNRQERARQASARLVLSQQRLEQATARVARATAASGQQLDSHVRFFKANEQAANRFRHEIESTGNALRSAGQGLTTLGTALSIAITVPLVALAKASVSAAVSVDSLRLGLKAVVGSAEEANIQLARLTELAKLPGIGFQEAIQGSIRLQAVGFSAKEAEKSLTEFSNAIALFGGGREQLDLVIVQLGQMAAKGKVLSQDLRPIINQAPAVGQALLKAFGTVNADDIAELTGSSQEFFNILVKELEQLPRAAGGARNAFENFSDAMFRAAATVGEVLLPPLVLLIETIEPAITTLARAFSNLPRPIQGVIVALAGFAALLGPTLTILGLFVLGIGRLAVAFAQLAGTGAINATIASLKQFQIAATATIARLLGLRAATVAAAAPWVILASAIGAIAAVLLLARSGQEELTAASEEQLRSTKDRIRALEDETEFLENLQDGVVKTAKEQEQLAGIYRTLGIEAAVRIKSLDTEVERTDALRVALQKLIEKERERLKVQGLTIAAKFIADLEKLNGLLAEQAELERKILVAQQTDTGLIADIDLAIKRHGELNGELAEQEKIVRQAGRTLEVYQEVSGESAETTLELSQRLTGAKVPLENLTEGFRKYTEQVEDAEAATRAFKSALDKVTVDLTDTSAIDKRFDAILKRIKETTHSTEDGQKALRNYLDLIPQLRESIERRRGTKSAESFIEGLFDEKKTRDQGASLRNAQEQLADALADVQQRSIENQIAIQKAGIEESLRLNESRFVRELISYKEFIGERARLQQLEIQGEIDRQKKIIQLAQEDISRAQARAGVTTGVEATRARAAEQKASAEKLAAETKILELQSRQKDVVAEAENDLREFNEDRLADLRALARELDEITGKQRQAGEAAIDERFRELLTDLNNEKEKALTEIQRTGIESFIKADLADFKAKSEALTAQLESAKLIKDPRESLREITRLQQELNKVIEEQIKSEESLAIIQDGRTKEQVQADVTQIENRKKQLKAVLALEEAQEKIRRAEEAQSDLERELTFQVEFRGLAEREAIERRLQGERVLRVEILKQQTAIQGVIDSLRRAGLEVPVALIEAVERLGLSVKGLGELDFTEQFRIAEEKLIKIQDEMTTRIADVERAIRSRDIAEIQGRLLIKQLNGEYIGQLERELEILKEIAKKSGDEGLRRQAQSAEQVVKDTRAAAEELDNFNKALKSVAIDSFNDSLSQLFRDLRDNTESAAQDILNFFNNLLNAVNDFIGQELARRITESLFPTTDEGGGIIDQIAGLLGLGGGGEDKSATGVGGGIAQAGLFSAKGGVELQAAATAAAASLTTAGATTAAALTSGGSGAAAAMVSGGSALLTSLATATATLTTGITSAAAAFASTVIAAGAAFAAAVAAASASQGLGGLGEGGGNEAAGDFLSAQPGGRVIRVAEAGHDEAVLTTDPKYAARQARILVEYLKRTRGLFGRFEIPEFAAGGFAAEMNLLSSINRGPSLTAGTTPQVALASGSGREVNLRQVLVDDRDRLGDFLNSPEGEQVMVTWLATNEHKFTRRR